MNWHARSETSQIKDEADIASEHRRRTQPPTWGVSTEAGVASCHFAPKIDSQISLT